MNSLKLYHFTVRNDRTGESTSFKGQGFTIEEAFKDGSANIQAAFRPSSSGGKRNVPLKLGVTTDTGKIVFRDKSEFESDIPFGRIIPNDASTQL